MNETKGSKVKRVVKQWVEKADHDLLMAEHAMNLGEDCPYDMVCFHAQQCAEKYTKAMLTCLGIDFPKSHDLTELFAAIPDTCNVDISPHVFEELNPYAVETRYPGNWDPIDSVDAEQAIKLAKEIRDKIKPKLDVN
jgi:HEPN domain-containing protein